MSTPHHARRATRDAAALGLALFLAAGAVVAFLPLRQGSAFGRASALVGAAALLASVLSLGWALSSRAGRPAPKSAAWFALGTALLDVLAISTLVSRLMAF